MLEIDRLSVSFLTDNGPVAAVRDVSLRVRPGATVALAGESGSGKSVTALTILRLVETTARVRTRGRIIFEGEEITKMDEEALRRLRGNRVAMIFQEPMTSLNPVYPIAKQLMEPLIIHQGLDRTTARTRAVALLDRCGIFEPEIKIDCYPHEMSGGQRQRVMIAMALACRPALLIADEPTTALDVTIQAQILSLIDDLKDEYGMAVLLISHDLGLVSRHADEVFVMRDGEVVESGPVATVFHEARHPYTRHLLDSVPQGTPPPRSGGPELITVEDVSVRFLKKKGFWRRGREETAAVDGVSLTIRKGTTLGLVGESGSGKSTLGQAILRLLPAAGRISMDGTRLDSLAGRRLRPWRRRMQVVFQDPFSALSPRMTIGGIIAEGLKVHSPELSSRQRRELVAGVMAEVGLDAAMKDRYPHEFSGGQRQRIAIARALILRPDFLVLDEPTSALDMTIQAQITKLLLDLQERHAMTYLFISHDLRVVRALADEVAVMRQGRIVEHGPAAEVFARPRHPYTKKLFQAAFLDVQPARGLDTGTHP